jgi:hypothetical protein
LSKQFGCYDGSKFGFYEKVTGLKSASGCRNTRFFTIYMYPVGVVQLYLEYIPRTGTKQGWELTSLVHESFQRGRELSRESVQLNSGSRAQDRFNKVQLNKDLMIREPY